MEAILKFNLPEDSEDFKEAQEGWKWKSALFELDQWIRGEVKHGEGIKDGDQVREKIREILQDHELFF